MGETGEGEGMVNIEKWKGFVKSLERMGEAKSVIISNLKQNFDSEQVSRTIAQIYTGYEQDFGGLLKAVQTLGSYKNAVDQEWERFTGSPGVMGEETGGETGAKFFADLTDKKPRGQVTLKRTDITINLELENKDDFLDLVNKDMTQNHKQLPGYYLHRVEGAVLDLATSTGEKGMLTAQKADSGLTVDVIMHEREHIVRGVFWRCGLTNWSEKKAFGQKLNYRQGIAEAVNAESIDELNQKRVLINEAGRTGSGMYDHIMVEERMAIEAEGSEIRGKELVSRLSLIYGCGRMVSEIEKFLRFLHKKGKLKDYSDSEYNGKLEQVFAGLLNDSATRLEKGIEVEDRLVRIYGDREMVKGMLEYIPLRYWPEAERMLVKYGSHAGKDGR